MSELARTQYFFTAEEFSLCRAAAGIDSLCCYALPGGGEPSEEAFLKLLFSLVRRGLLQEGEDGFALRGEPAECFRLMGQSPKVLFVYQRRHAIPIRLLYGGGDAFVSLQPGRRAGEYAGVSLYRTGEMEEWIADAGLLLPGNMPDGLLAAVEGEKPLRGGEVRSFLARNAWPANRQPGPPEEALPEEIFGYVESRRAFDGLLLARAYLVRQPLFDQIVIGTAEGVAQRLYRPDALAEVICGMLRDKEED